MSARKDAPRIAVFALALSAAVGIVSLVHAQGAGADAGKGGFKVDPVHSSVIFKIKHLGATNFYGRFNEATGSFDLNEGGSINVAINTDSLMSGNPKRDTHLKGPDFFSAKEFPQATFKSTSIKSAGSNRYEVSGDLTLHGVTKPVTAKVESTGSGKGMRGGTVAGIEARFTIKRSDFGVGKGPASNMLGDDVEMIVALEGGQ